jgi:PhoH-like ATPase
MLLLYVVDTSVILSDPKCLERLSNKDIVLPLTVVIELEEKRHHPELGFPARCALRDLEEYRKHYNLTETVQTGKGGSIKIELNNIDDSSLPDVLRVEQNDNRILAVASNLNKDYDVTLLSKDLPLRLKASIAGIHASDYETSLVDVNWSGMVELEVDDYTIEDIYDRGYAYIDSAIKYPVNTGFILKSGSKSALGRFRRDGFVSLIREKSIFDVRGRSAEQRVAIDALCDDSVGIVSLAGKAGTGKSILAIAAGLEEVIERRSKNKVTVFRPLYAVGGQDIGFLPGTAEEKMEPWTAAVYDALEAFCGPEVIEQVIEEELLEVLPLTYIRGRTLTNNFVIIDEAQNLSEMVLLTALSRLGHNAKVVMTHDVGQRDNLRVGKYDGISAVVSKLSGSELFAHITLRKSERSPIAELVSSVLEG